MTEQHGAPMVDGAAEIIAAPTDDPASGWMGKLLARVPRHAIIGQIGWVAGSYGISQVMRLVTNVVLARLLAPQLFGVMLIVNTLRTGAELLSDIGIGHNIISNPRGGEPAFFNTAFTLQVIRGLALGALVLAFAAPVARLYDRPELGTLVPLMSVLFILSGLQAPSRYLMMKHGQVRAYALSDIGLAVASLAINVGLALYTPTVWALFVGLILTTLLQTLLTYFLMDPGVLRLQLDRNHVRQIMSFGKWVFASSLIYFLAMNYDRLYFAKAVSFTVLGVYGVARTFSDAAAQLVQRMGNMLIYPKIAASRQDGAALRATLAPVRRRALLAVAAALAIAVAGSDRLILVLYDARYHAAAFMLPILLASMWFSILATLGESVMMGTGRPAHAARANAAKFVFVCVGLPIALHVDGMVAALLVIGAGDVIRYLSFAISERSRQLSFARQDAEMTLALLGMILMWRIMFDALGLVPGLADWWHLGARLHG